jgi:FixJ family two-component response regulator
MATDRRKFISLLALGVPASAGAMRKGLPFPIQDGIDEKVIEQDQELVELAPGLTHHEKVLIVEPKENERSGLAELVSSWGYRVETAANGAEGLETAAQGAHSLVIAELKMPRMGGLELMGYLAEQAQTIAVIVVTAHGTIDSAVQAMRMGAYDYMPKPIDTERLRMTLSNASVLLGFRAEMEAARRRLREQARGGRRVTDSYPEELQRALKRRLEEWRIPSDWLEITRGDHV